MQRIALHSEQTTLDDVWKHYEALREVVVRELEDARLNLSNNKQPKNPELFSMTLEEVEAYYHLILTELDTQTSLFLLAATEATIRVDFFARVYEKRKDSLSRIFRSIYKERCDHSKIKVRLEEDILEMWSENHPNLTSQIGKLKGAFKYRHWLAHGRYWVPKLGQNYDPSGLVQIVSPFFTQTGLSLG